MVPRVLCSNKLRLASFGVAATLVVSIIFPNAYVLAGSISTDIAPSDATAVNGIAVTDHSTDVNASDVATTLAHDGDLLAASDQTRTISDGSNAIKAVTAGVSVDVPKDPSNGVTLGATNGPKLDIQLPNADDAMDAKQIAPGTVAYPSSNGSANAVQATEDGGARMLTVIDNPTAPTEYDYKLSLPDSGHIDLTGDGGAMVIDGNGTVLATVATPWAHDAVGTSIKTYFTTDGTTLVQHIEHNVPGVVYPVTADPWFLAALVAAAETAALGCLISAAQTLIWDGAQWAIRHGNWYWKQEAQNLAVACAQGAVFGWIGSFIPSAVKQAVFNSVKPLVVNYLLWLVTK